MIWRDNFLVFWEIEKFQILLVNFLTMLTLLNWHPSLAGIFSALWHIVAETPTNISIKIVQPAILNSLFITLYFHFFSPYIYTYVTTIIGIIILFMAFTFIKYVQGNEWNRKIQILSRLMCVFQLPQIHFFGDNIRHSSDKI